MDNVEIGNRIQQARSYRHYTLDEVAQKIGVAKSTIQRYENGKIQKIKLPVIDSIANALNVNPAWLVGKSNEMEIVYNHKDIIIMKYYNSLNDIGKKEATKRVEELTHLPQYSLNSSNILLAAHERTDVPHTKEGLQHDLDIINDDANW